MTIMLITGDSIIGDLIDNNPEAKNILLGHGMHCAGCPSARGETLAEACEMHGLDLDTLIKSLNKK